MPPGPQARPLLARAPTRVDLAGGTLDLWPLYLFFPGSRTLNVAIDLHSTARLSALASGYEIESLDQGRSVRARALEEIDPCGPLPLVARLVRHFAPLPGLRVETRNLSPPGAGLGGSSSLAVALAAGLSEWCGSRLDRQALITLVGSLEAQVLRAPTGTQDYYAAVHGGGSLLRLGPEGVRREELPGLEGWLVERLVLCYTGAPHASGIHNWDVFRRAVDGERDTCAALEAIASCAADMEAALRARDVRGVAAALGREWGARKSLAPGVSTPRIEQVIAWGMEAGALAGKVCGAGGGGCLVLVAGEGGGPALAGALRQRGVQVLPFGFAAGGLTVSRE
jgi:D-glycero-alpha-D-manno-heptose-7-phosphate kinase